MDSVGSVVLIAVTVAVGLAFVAGIVQLWRHQPVHQDDTGQDDAGPDDTAGTDEETVDLGMSGGEVQSADEAETVALDRDGEGDPDEATVELPSGGRP